MPIKALGVLKSFGLNIPLRPSQSKQFILFLKIFSFIFGDGNLTKKFKITLSGEETDLENLKKEVEHTFNLKGKIRRLKINSKIGKRTIRGVSFVLEIQGKGNQILGRLLHAAGAPVGDKVIIPFTVPKWIMEAPKWIKKLFLEVILGNELETPRLRKDFGCHFDSIRFRMIKIKKYILHIRNF